MPKKKQIKRRTCVMDGKLRKESLALKDDYRVFNRRYFYGKLPKNMFLFWHDKNDSDSLGLFWDIGVDGNEWRDFYAISIASYLRHPGSGIHWPTLLHEMIHANQRRRGDSGHGKDFDRERKRLLRYNKIRTWAL